MEEKAFSSQSGFGTHYLCNFTFGRNAFLIAHFRLKCEFQLANAIVATDSFATRCVIEIYF